MASCVWFMSPVGMTVTHWGHSRRNEFGKKSVWVKTHACWLSGDTPFPTLGDIQMQVPPHLRLLSFTVACGGLKKEGRPLYSTSLFASEALKQSSSALSFGTVSALGLSYFTLFNLPLFQSVSDPHSRAHLKPHTLSFLQMSLFDPFPSIHPEHSVPMAAAAKHEFMSENLWVEKWSHTWSPSWRSPSILYVEG